MGKLLNKPYWWEELPLTADADELLSSCEVTVIGGGLTGLTCAIALAKLGKSVTVIDSGTIGAGASSRSAGQVSGGVTTGKTLTGRTVPFNSPEHRKELLREAGQALSDLERALGDLAIDCDYQPTGRVTAAWTPRHLSFLAGRVSELNTLTGADARILTKEETADEIGSDFYHGGLLIRRAGQLHPGKLAAGLADAARKSGVRVVPDTAALHIKRLRDQFQVKTVRGPINSDIVVLATNAYTGHLNPFLKRRIIPVTSHVIATAPIPATIGQKIIPMRRSVSESRRVLNYFRFTPDFQRLIFGGRTRFYPLSPERIANLLRRAMIARFPDLGQVDVTHIWSGQVALTFDAIPHIGGDNGLYYCIGCNGSGIVLMTHLGRLLARKIVTGERGAISAFDRIAIPGHALYFGEPWFMPFVGSYLQLRDFAERRFA